MTLTGTRIQSLSSQLSAASIAGTMFMVIDAASGGVSSKALVSDVANAIGTVMTSMTGLTTPLSVSQGGTGTSTLTAHGVMVGNGTAGVALTGTGSTGQPLVSGGSSANPAFSTISNAMVSGLGTASTHASTDFLASSVVTTAGDLIVGSGAGTVARLAKGTDTYVLTMVSGSVAWAAAAGGGGGSLPLQTGSDPGNVLENHAGTVILSTDSNGNILVSNDEGDPLISVIDGNYYLAIRFGAICDATGTSVVSMSATNILLLNGSTGIDIESTGSIALNCSTGLGFFGAIVAQQAANQAMTDSTGGTPSTTLAAVSGTLDDADINNNFASLNARLAEIRTLLTAYGLGT